jgi:MFS family permease
MWLTANNFQTVFWVAVIPAFLAFALIVFAVHDPAPREGLRKVRSPLSIVELRRLGPAFWWVTVVATVFTLARFSEAFLILKAQAVGLPIFLIPLVLVVMNIAYAVISYPVGARSDRMDRTTLLIAGFALLIAADVVLGFATDLVGVAIGVILWGAHMGFTQGLLATLIADSAPAELRGTAYGIFNLFGGVALLAASVVAGALWDATGSRGTFLVGAAITTLALAGLVTIRHRLRPRSGATAVRFES